jgi:hypothetical protein
VHSVSRSPVVLGSIHFARIIQLNEIEITEGQDQRGEPPSGGAGHQEPKEQKS